MSVPENLPASLSDFFCSGTCISTLPETLPESLRVLDCSNNLNLTSLPENLPVGLWHLDCSQNFYLTSLPISILNCVNLTEIVTIGTPLDNPPIINRFIARINDQNTNRTLRNGFSVYNDSQSVHNHSIQESIRESIFALLKTAPPSDRGCGFKTAPPSDDEAILIKDITENTILTSRSKSALIEYYNDKSEHSTIGLTFGDLLVPVWNRIVTHPTAKDEILSILNTELLDAECMCFTGRISRLVNCLNGFYDDIVVRIDESSQIGNIVTIAREKLNLIGTYTVESHKRDVTNALVERGYTLETINAWVDAIE